MDVANLVFFVLGLFLLIVGAEVLVRGAVQLSRILGIAPLLIGLTVVAFGTSAPELAVSVQASLSEQTELTIGNVVGSNIFNVLLILGVSAVIRPLTVSVKLVRWDVPIMIGVSVFTLLLGLDGALGWLDGLVLFAGIMAYTAFSIRQSSREPGVGNSDQLELLDPILSHSTRQWIMNGGLILLGLSLLMIGSGWLNQGAIDLARAFGVSELVIGLTLVAAGTSLPEVATSVLATIRGERDIAVGNIVGSNIFNLLAVLGLSGIVAPAGLSLSPAVLRFDLPIMIAVAVACLPIFFTGHTISRWEGWLFLSYYIAYTAYLVLASARHEVLPVLGSAMLVFVIPLTVVTLLVLTLRELRVRGRRAR